MTRPSSRPCPACNFPEALAPGRLVSSTDALLVPPGVPCPECGGSGEEPDWVALRSAELALLAHLTQRLRVAWAAATWSGRDPEDGRPVVLVYATDIEPARRWVEARGGRWNGHRLRAVPVGKGR